MTNGNDLVEYEERNYVQLVDAFIENHKTEWDDFVQEAYSEDNARVL